MNIISFSGAGKLKEYLDKLEGYLLHYADAKDIEKELITP